jgi:hypothetical protein
VGSAGGRAAAGLPIGSLFVFACANGQGCVMTNLRERVSVPRRLEGSALVVYAVVFTLLLVYGRPGLGISQGFYLAIVLVALAGGPVSGFAAGVLATLLFGIAAHVGRNSFSVVPWPMGVRFVAFTLSGLAVGYFAQRGRRMLAESFHVLDEVLGLARREVGTGARTAAGISDRIAVRVGLGDPFAVLVGEVALVSDRAVRDALRALSRALPDGSDVGRVGSRRVVVAAAAQEWTDAERLVGALERELPGTTFGWAFHPEDGDDALGLVGSASERLQARRGTEAAVRLAATE